MWKGVVSFGMVSIPVRLYVATESHSASFHQLCAEHMSRIKYRRWCQEGDHEVQYSDIIKGYEVSSDNYVVIEDSDLENLPLPTARAIEITEFVPENDIQGGLYFKSAYYVEPEEVGRKPYQLLMQALAETQMTAVAKVAFRDREHLCSLQPEAGLLLMNTLHWPDEIRSADGLKGTRSQEGHAKERQRRKNGEDLPTTVAMLPTTRANKWGWPDSHGNSPGARTGPPRHSSDDHCSRYFRDAHAGRLVGTGSSLVGPASALPTPAGSAR